MKAEGVLHFCIYWMFMFYFHSLCTLPIKDEEGRPEEKNMPEKISSILRKKLMIFSKMMVSLPPRSKSSFIRLHL